MLSPSERRTRRSHDPMTALSLFLERIASRNALGGLVVTDLSGRMVAGAGISSDLPLLGKLGSEIATGGDSSSFSEVTRGEDFFTQTFSVKGRSYVLSSLGSRVRKSKEALGAIERILTTLH